MNVFKKMMVDYLVEAGYHGYSKSNNAIRAENENKFPASVAAKKLGVSTDAIKTFIPTSEWHHYSSYYNRVNVYDITPYLMLKNNEDMSDMYDSDEIEEYVSNYERMKEMSKKDKKEKDIHTFKANVEYIEWTGTRNRPKANIKKYDNIDVEQKGSFYTFYLPNGGIVKKKIGSNGTKVQSLKDIENDKIRRQNAIKNFEKNSSKEALKWFVYSDIEPNSDWTHFYKQGRKPTQFDYINKNDFFQQGEIRASSKNPERLSSSGIYLEKWENGKWIPIEDKKVNEMNDEWFLDWKWIQEKLR